MALPDGYVERILQKYRMHPDGWSLTLPQITQFINEAPWDKTLTSGLVRLKDEDGTDEVHVRVFDDNLSPVIAQVRGGGSPASPTALSDTDQAGYFAFGGQLSTTVGDTALGGGLRAVAAGDWSNPICSQIDFADESDGDLGTLGNFTRIDLGTGTPMAVSSGLLVFSTGLNDNDIAFITSGCSGSGSQKAEFVLNSNHPDDPGGDTTNYAGVAVRCSGTDSSDAAAYVAVWRIKVGSFGARPKEVKMYKRTGGSWSTIVSSFDYGEVDFLQGDKFALTVIPDGGTQHLSFTWERPGQFLLELTSYDDSSSPLTSGAAGVSPGGVSSSGSAAVTVSQFTAYSGTAYPLDIQLVQVLDDSFTLSVRQQWYNTGDIGFGTDEAMYWDDSAASLGLGVTDPARLIEAAGGIQVSGDNNEFRIESTDEVGTFHWRLYGAGELLVLECEEDGDVLYMLGTGEIYTADLNFYIDPTNVRLRLGVGSGVPQYTWQIEDPANGSTIIWEHNEEVLSGLSGSTVSTTGLIPAGAFDVFVTVRVTTLITSGDGGDGFAIGDGSDDDAWGADIAFAAGTTTDGTDWTVAPQFFDSGGDITLTCNNGGTFSAGAVRVVVWYRLVTAPTS